jgi:hypothetical protein
MFYFAAGTFIALSADKIRTPNRGVTACAFRRRNLQI